MEGIDVLKDALERYVSAARALDEERWLQRLSPDVVSRVGGAPPTVGREALREFLRGTLVTYPDLVLQDDGVLAAGRLAAVGWTMRAHRPDGRAVLIPALDVVRFDEHGRVCDRCLHIDATDGT